MRAFFLALGLSAASMQAAPFDKGGVLGVGAREAGQGGAVVARIDKATALWWNPAGLDLRPDFDASLEYGDGLGGIRFDSAFSHRGYLLPFELGYGIGYRHVGTPAEVAEEEYALGLSFPFNDDGSLVAGFALRTLQAKVATTSASGYGLDLGLRWKVPGPVAGLTLGLAARDIQAGMDWPAGPRSDPAQLFQMGAAWAFDERSSIEFDGEFVSDPSFPQRGSQGFKVGAERWWGLPRFGLKRLAALRLGYLQNNALVPTALGGQFSFGVGVQYRDLCLDYAFTQDVSNLGPTQRLGISYAYAPPQLQGRTPEPTPEATTKPTVRPTASATPTPAPTVAESLALTASPPVYNPQRDAKGLLLSVTASEGYMRAASSRLEIRPLTGPAVVYKQAQGLPLSYAWDGKRPGGANAAAGAYRAILTAYDAAGATLGAAEAPFQLELGTGRLRLSPEADIFAPLAQSVRQQARLGVGYDGKDAQRWTLSVSRQGAPKPVRVLSGKSLPATLAWDGRDRQNKAVPDGTYVLNLAVLLRGGSTVTAQASVEVDTRRPALELDATPRIFAPGGDTGSVNFKLGLSGEAGIPAVWTLRVEALDGKAIKSFSGVGSPPQSVVWNGGDEAGKGVPDASLYYADLSVEMESGAMARLPRLAVASRPVEPKQPFRVPLQTLRFESGEEVIALEDFRGLKEAAAAVKKYSTDYVVLVAGHASQAENARNGLGELELSFLRAKAVRDYLIDSEGLDPKRVRSAGYGSEQPVPGNGGRERDRRVEVILYAQ